MARYLGEFADAGLVNIAGGCCGNTPEHIAAIARALVDRPPRRLSVPAAHAGRAPAASEPPRPSRRGRCACRARSRSRSSRASS